jgi:copper chaperone
MIQLNIPSMSCGHCVKAVTQAVQEIDPQAKVDVNLGSKLVQVDSVAPQQKIIEALAEAGYQPA